MRKYRKLIALLLAALMLCGCTTAVEPSVSTSVPTENAQEETSLPAEDGLAEAESQLAPELQALVDSGMFKERELTGAYKEKKAVALTPENPDITEGGVYILSGSYTDVTITVSVPDTDKVQLVLDNAMIENQNGPAIYIAEADKVYITALEGTENKISDGTEYIYAADDGADSAIFSRADLVLNGSGSLEIQGNCNHAVETKDDLVVAMDSLTISAQGCGLKGKDSVRIAWGQIQITSGGDAIKSDNEDNEDKGFVYIADCDLTIDSQQDGIQGETLVTLLDGSYHITCGGGAQAQPIDEDASYKGIKSGLDMTISGGEYVLDTLDDAVHGVNVDISGGTFQIATGDDGVHADEVLTVSGGDILITESYEGLEATELYISGGTMDITASDDGLNAAGDTGETGFGGFAPFGGGVGDIAISGGYIVIDAEGDGIDSNNTTTVSGGIVLVSGPTTSMNGALDCDGGSTITGGIVIATGASGMAQGFGTAENQGSILATITNQAGGTPVALCDETGAVVVCFTPRTAYSSVAVSAPGVQSGSTYTLVVGGQAADTDENGFAENTTITGGETVSTIEMTSEIYSEGGFGGGFPGGMGGGFPGGMGGGRGQDNGDFQRPDMGEMGDFSPPDMNPGDMGDFNPEDMGDFAPGNMGGPQNGPGMPQDGNMQPPEQNG